MLNAVSIELSAKAAVEQHWKLLWLILAAFANTCHTLRWRIELHNFLHDARRLVRRPESMKSNTWYVRLWQTMVKHDFPAGSDMQIFLWILRDFFLSFSDLMKIQFQRSGEQEMTNILSYTSPVCSVDLRWIEDSLRPVTKCKLVARVAVTKNRVYSPRWPAGVHVKEFTRSGMRKFLGNFFLTFCDIPSTPSLFAKMCNPIKVTSFSYSDEKFSFLTGSRKLFSSDER